MMTAAARNDAACSLCGGAEFTLLFTKRGWHIVRCRGCRLVSIRPLPTEQQIAQHHEDSYAKGGYAVYAAAESIRAAIARYRLDAVRRLAPDGPWLDVGCSTGALLAEAARVGIQAEGLEMSPAAVAQARGRGLEVHEGVVERFAPPRPFAAITAFDFVEHLRDPLRFVRRAASWLVPGGLLVLTAPNLASAPARLMGRHWYYYAPPDHLHYFTPATLRALQAAGGLRDIRVRPTSKPLTLEYAAAALGQFNARLGRLVRPIVARMPKGLRSRLWPLPIGEMVATARSGR